MIGDQCTVFAVLLTRCVMGGAVGAGKYEHEMEKLKYPTLVFVFDGIC
jgi:hypothetical protein